MTSSSQTQPSSEAFDLMRMDRQIQRRVMRQRAVPIAAFAGMVLAGISKRGVWGWLGASVGLLGLARQLVQWDEARPEWEKLAQPRLALSRWFGRQRLDPVDHTSATSFPASDPPGHGAGSDGGTQQPL